MTKETNLTDSGKATRDESGISDNALLIFTWINYSVVCLAVDIFGIVTNIINIICFTKQGFQESINVSLLGLSVSDLFSLTTLSWLNISFTLAAAKADLEFDPMEVGYLVAVAPHFVFSRVTSCITALITLERCLCVIVPLKVKLIFTARRTTIMILSIYTACLLCETPVYAFNKLEMKYSQHLNRSILGLVFAENRQYAQQIIFIMNNFSIPLTSFVVIVICTVILVIKLQTTTIWREKSATLVQIERVSSRNQKVGKMVVMVSSLFIACFIPICITMMLVAFEPALSYGGRYINIGVLLGGLSIILESLNSSMNIFIYYHISSKYRDTFEKIFLNYKNSNVM